MGKERNSVTRNDGPSSAVRIRVYKRDRFACTYCGTPGTDAELEVDHIIPVSGGGSHHISNLTTACRKCNQEKGAKKMIPTRSNSFQDGLVGLYVHVLEDSKIQYQGAIVGRDGDAVLVQLFSWLTGDPGLVQVFPIHVILSDRCHLYRSARDMVEAYCRHPTCEDGEQTLRVWEMMNKAYASIGL